MRPGRSVIKTRAALARAVSLILLVPGLAPLAAGFLVTDIGASLPEDRVDDTLRISLYTLLAAWIVRLLQPMRYANSLLFLWVVLHVLIVGIAPAAGAAAVAVAAVGLGTLALPERIPVGCRWR